MNHQFTLGISPLSTMAMRFWGMQAPVNLHRPALKRLATARAAVRQPFSP